MMTTDTLIRPATAADWPAIWAMLKPVFKAAQTYAVAPDISADGAHAMWMDLPYATFVATRGGEITGTYYIKTNAQGGGAHVCNCGYVVSEAAQGQGIARAMCEHSQNVAKQAGYTAMQFNMVLATNVGAVALWHKLGFETVGTLPKAFHHPSAGLVDGYVMYKMLG